jgi:hypothetical protein
LAAANPEDYAIECGPMGPIGEGQALILRVNRNCPWNQCLFCPVYKDKTFSARNVAEIKRDIDAIIRIRDLLDQTSRYMGLQGLLRAEVVQETVKRHPEIYGQYPLHVSEAQLPALTGLNNVARWLMNGATRVFLQDANALAMKPAKLAEVLLDLKGGFPSVDTVTCYARSKTCARRSLEELCALKEAGLSWCFVGIESGDDDTLEDMRKGVTKEEHIQGGETLMASGIHMAAFVMPGLAGSNIHRSRKHIADTVTVLNAIQPTEVRVRSLALLEETPLYEQWKSGAFDPAGEDQVIEELRMLVEGLSFDCTFETLQMTNPLFSIKGPFFQTKEAMLDAIEWYRALPPLQRAQFLLHRFTKEGYLDFVKAWGKDDARLYQEIEEAETSLARGADDALKKASRAIFTIKSKGVP